MQSIVAEQQTKTKHYLKFLCFQKTEKRIEYETRLLFSIYCDQWFRRKTKPTMKLLRQLTGFRPAIIARIKSELEQLGLLDSSKGRSNGKPIFVDKYFFKKRSFTPSRWWKGIQCRVVKTVAKPKAIAVTRGARLGQPIVKPFAVVTSQRFKSTKADVVFAAIEYQQNYKKRRCGPAYVAAVTGLTPKTCSRIVAELVEAELVKKTDKGLVAVVKEDAKTFTEAEGLRKLVEAELTGHIYPMETYAKIVEVGVKNFDKFKRLCENTRKPATGRLDFDRLQWSLFPKHRN